MIRERHFVQVLLFQGSAGAPGSGPSRDRAQEPPDLVVVAIADVGPIEQEGEGVNRYLVARLRGAPKRVEARYDCATLLPEDKAHPAAEAGLRVANGGQSSDERREIFRSQVESTWQHTTQG